MELVYLVGRTIGADGIIHVFPWSLWCIIGAHHEYKWVTELVYLVGRTIG